MLVLRLARTGRRNQPKYRIVVAEHSKPVNGKVVEIVGHYEPAAQDKPLIVNKEAISAWISRGVKPSNTVARLLNKNEGFDLPVEQRAPRKPKKDKAEEAEKPAAVKAPVDAEAGGEAAPEEAPAAATEETASEAEAEKPAEAAPVEEAPVEPEAEAATEEVAPAEEEKPAEGAEETES